MVRQNALAVFLTGIGFVRGSNAQEVEECSVGPLDLRSGTRSSKFGREEMVVPLTFANRLNRSLAVYVSDPADEDQNHLAPAAQAILSVSGSVNVTAVSGELLQFRDAGTGSLMCEVPILERYVSSMPSTTIELGENASICNLHAKKQEACVAHQCVVTPKTFSINRYYRNELPGFLERFKHYGWKELPLLVDANTRRVSNRVQFGVLESFASFSHPDEDCCGNKIAFSSGYPLSPILNKMMLPFTMAAAAEQAGKPVPTYLVRSFVMSKPHHQLALLKESCNVEVESGPKQWIMKPHAGEQSTGLGIKTMFNREVWEVLSDGPRQFKRICSKPWPSHFVHEPLSQGRRKEMMVQDFISDFMPWPGSRSESGRRWQIRAFMLLTEIHPPTLHFLDAVAFKGGAPSNASDSQASFATNTGATKREVKGAHKRDYIFPLPEVQHMYDTLDPEANVPPTWVSDVMPKYVCEIGADLTAAVMANVAPSTIGRNRYHFFALDFLVGANMTLKLMETQQCPNMNFECLKPCEGRVAATCDTYKNISQNMVDLLLRHYDLEPKAAVGPAPRVHSCPVRTQVVSLRRDQRRFGDAFDILGQSRTL
eukprot:TRINITY_DN1633_c0_g1_i1.p1 TRINITY_DN1633_c0_g1~~TRINITY_DN1633_c0_g1_i1.p1  ORF type:complete len:626 (-),score=58.54 TRINITY_DN1633_c0_g1_i1:364-2154(-)